MHSPGFNSVAEDYDRFFTNTQLGRAQRNQVWDFLKKTIQNLPGKPNILDLNCGTGEDAIFLREKGCQITAIDISDRMLEKARSKCEEKGIADIKFSQFDMRNLLLFDADEKYDVILSNFGGINCLHPEELETLAKNIRSKIVPGGYVILIVMPDKCMMETIYGLAKGNISLSFRRHSSPQKVELQSGENMTTWYYSPDQIKSYFCTSNFHFLDCFPIGFFPSYLEGVYRHSGWQGNLTRKIDAFLKKIPIFANWSYHFLISFTPANDSVT